MNGILCVIDGMTDEDFCREDYPRLAALARGGAWGELDTLPPGAAPGTLDALLTLLGLAPGEIPRQGRGWIEAVGAGLRPHPDDLALRISWAQVEDGAALGLANAPARVAVPPGMSYHALGGSKGLLLIHGWGKRCGSLDTRQPHGRWGDAVETLLPGGCPPLEEFCRSFLPGALLPLPWGQSAALTLPHPGILAGGAAVTAQGFAGGLVQLTGLEPLPVASATGDTDTDLAAKAAAARIAAATHPVTLLHLGGADEAAHRRDAAAKRAFLRRVDSEVLTILAASGHRLLVCSDHGTSPRTGGHLAGAQPFVLTGTPLRGDLGRLPGGMAIPLLQGETIWQR